MNLSNVITVKPVSEADWKAILGNSRMTTEQLLNSVGLGTHPLTNSQAEKLFELRVPGPYLDKIEYGNPEDPLLLQVLPQAAELLKHEDYSDDPLAEADATANTGLLHKYKSRVLLITTQSCAIHCRYCFRRNFPYEQHRQSTQDWQQAFDYIKQDQDVNEVILSGGDPLTLNNDYLLKLLIELDQLPNIKRIRIHSRLISSLPQRIDGDLIDGLSKLSKKLIVVMHCNHSNELDDDVGRAIAALKTLDITLLNQSVLLKGINDDARVLAKLSEKLFDYGVMPYYLFTLDKVSGAAHFDLPAKEIRNIYQSLLGKLPGFLVPKLMSEIPGKKSKVPFI